MCVDVGKDVYGVSRHFRNGGGVEVVLASCCQPEPFGKEEAHHNGGLFALDNADGFVCRCCGVQSEEALPELPCVRMWQLGVYPLGVEVLDAFAAQGVVEHDFAGAYASEKVLLKEDDASFATASYIEQAADALQSLLRGGNGLQKGIESVVFSVSDKDFFVQVDCKITRS